MRNLFICFCGIVLSFVSSGCSNQNESLDENPTVEYALELLNNDGMTCNTMSVLIKLDPDEVVSLGEQVREQYNPEALAFMIDTRERSCSASSETEEGASSISQEITGTYQVEFIEEASGSGGNSGSIYVDSASSSWMCNSGSPENPADYIGQYNVSGAYANRSSLRIRGTNAWASCYIQASNATRVYSDDDMRVCIGFWHVFLCGAGAPVAGETKVWR